MEDNKTGGFDAKFLLGEDIVSSPLAGLSPKEKILAFIKNRQTWGFLLSMVIMAVIAVAFFYPDNFEGRDLSQHDMVQGLANGQEISRYEAETGVKSWWTNSLFGGMPAFQISPAYPSDSLFRWFTSVYGLGLPAPSNLLFMMMLGMMILMTVLKIRWEYGLIGAIAWGFSTYFIIIIGAGHIWKFVTLAYIPPTLAGIFLAYRGRYLAGMAMTAFFAMMQIMSNHIQMTYYFLFVVLGIAIACAWAAVKTGRVSQWLKATGALAIAGVLAVCANLPNLYHTYKYAKESQRAGSELAEAGGEGSQSRDYLYQYSYGQAETLTLLVPNVKGGASAKPYQGKLRMLPLAEVDAAQEYMADPLVSTYLQQSPQYFGEPESTNGPVYVGAIIFALFVMGCFVVKGPVKWTLIALTLLSVFLALGRNMAWFSDLFVDYMPMYGQFRTPESILVVAEFTIPLLAVMGLYRLFTDKADQKSNYRWMLVSFGIVGLICAALALVPSLAGPTMDNDINMAQLIIDNYTAQGYPADQVAQITVKNPSVYVAVENIHKAMISADAWRSFLFIAIAAAILIFGVKSKTNGNLVACAIAILVLCDLYSVNKRYLDSDSFDPVKTTEVKSLTPTAADAAILQDKDMNYRVANFDDFSGSETSYFHKAVGGYHSAKLRRYNDLIEQNLIANPSVLNMLNARYIIYGGQVQQNPDALGNAWFVDRIDYVDTPKAEAGALSSLDTSVAAVADKRFESVLGSAKADSTAVITETSYASDRLSYESRSATDGVAVFSEIYFPWGWKATIDGKPAEIGRVNYVLRAIRVPAGKHKIDMIFDPESVHTTTTVAYAAVILIYLLIIASIMRALLVRKVK